MSGFDRVEWLAATGRAWGAVEHFHPWVADGRTDWDEAGREAIAALRSASTEQDARSALAGMLAALDDPATRVAVDSDPHVEDVSGATPVVDNEVSSPQLRHVDDIVVLAARDFQRSPYGLELIAQIGELLSEAAAAEPSGIVIDLRHGGAYFGMALTHSSFPELMAEDVVVPSARIRSYSGYPPRGALHYQYGSGFWVGDGVVVAARPGPLAGVPLAFVTDRMSMLAEVVALLAAGRAMVAHEGSMDAPTTRVSIGEHLDIVVRSADVVLPDGTVGMPAPLTFTETRPEVVSRSDGVVAAIALLRGERKLPAPLAAGRLLPARSTAIDQSGGDAALPTVEQRLLGLFRYWNVIRYFFPYHDLMDQPWDTVLPWAIPLVEQAANATDYARALLQVANRVQDGHAFLDSPTVTEIRGSHQPDVAVREAQGRTVVVNVGSTVDDVTVGDILVSIDGEPATDRITKLLPFVPASTPAAARVDTHKRWLLHGPEGSRVELELEAQDGAVRRVSLPRTRPAVGLAERPQPVFGVLDSGDGYMDLTRLVVPQIDEALEAVRNSRALIVDMRGYPNGTAWGLSQRLADQPFIGARFTRLEPQGADPDYVHKLEFAQRLHPRREPPWRYRRPLVVLINEEAISQAEHTCLFLSQASEDVTFIGSPTAGANGDVTSVMLPGGITAMFTGQGVTHADGTVLQRRGIQPDVSATPTIAGIRAGRDEVLEAAVALLDARLAGDATATTSHHDIARSVDAADDVERILRGLPAWFGVEEALVGYVDNARELPTWVASVNGEVVGVCTVRQHDRHAAEIDVLAVQRAHHRRGIGRDLLEAVEADLAASGIQLLHVKTLGPSEDSAAYAATRAFYEAVGYRPIEEFAAGTIWEDNACLLMVKTLTPDA